MTTTPDDDLRARAEARVKAREDFRIHFLIYLLVNGLLWVIWFATDQNPGVPWPAFATLGWGSGLVAHWWTVYGVNDARREAEIQKEMRRLRGDRDWPARRQTHEDPWRRSQGPFVCGREVGRNRGEEASAPVRVVVERRKDRLAVVGGGRDGRLDRGRSGSDPLEQSGRL